MIRLVKKTRVEQNEKDNEKLIEIEKNEVIINEKAEKVIKQTTDKLKKMSINEKPEEKGEVVVEVEREDYKYAIDDVVEGRQIELIGLQLNIS